MKFCTSGVRGLVEQMTDRVCYAYTTAFLQHLDQQPCNKQRTVAIAGDLRLSTPRIMQAVALAAEHQGYQIIHCGFIPTPAVSLFGFANGIASIMVTGSHIPDDRNGIKYCKADGEILKPDEQGIDSQSVTIDEDLFDQQGKLVESYPLPPTDDTANDLYIKRYLNFFPSNALSGMRIGVYEHSSVARGMMAQILEALGAYVIRLGFSQTFIPVDTEAIRPEDITLGREWARQHGLDAIVSTDGDGDRPLVGDEQGEWFRGDVAGILCARYLKARQIVTPVSSNTAVEQCGWFEHVSRTRIGSPYVIEQMDRLQAAGGEAIVGYEANGGFLIQSTMANEQGSLAPLPTRDAIIVILSMLVLAKEQQGPLSQLRLLLPPRYTHSDRLSDFPTEQSRQLLTHLLSGESELNMQAIQSLFGTDWGVVTDWDMTDGLRLTFEGGDIIHLRPSGNAPELRCYAESGSETRACEMVKLTLGKLVQWKTP